MWGGSGHTRSPQRQRLACAASTRLALLCCFAYALLGCNAEPLTRCRLGIVGAGAPRTGSTHEIKLVKLAVTNFGLDSVFVDMGFWKWDEHKQMDETRARAHREHERVRHHPPHAAPLLTRSSALNCRASLRAPACVSSACGRRNARLSRASCDALQHRRM